VPLDHYIPQVHLKNFYSPSLGDRMYAIRKTDLRAFTPNSRSVCRIMDGSTNAYLRENRVLEEFLKTVEPKYNAALEKLTAGKIDSECIYAIAGFVSYVIACSPAGMRIQSGPLKSADETQAAMMDTKGLFPPPPAVLGSSTLTELLKNGLVEVPIDPKYPQAIGISSILRFVAIFGNSTWEILYNDSAESPFFTSDFPAAIEKADDPSIPNRIVPLAPSLALRIKPNPLLNQDQLDSSFKNFGLRKRNVSDEELTKLNRLIVRCAEDTVFYRDDYPWVRPFVEKNRHYRIEPYTRRTKTPAGTLLVSTQRIVAGIQPQASQNGLSAWTT